MTRTRPRRAEEGREPDYRFSLANERTFLAWLRTGLTLLAGAVAVVQLVPAVDGIRAVLAVLLAVTGTALATFAYARWAQVQRAMRRDEALPTARRWLIVTGSAVATAGTVVVLLVVLHLR